MATFQQPSPLQLNKSKNQKEIRHTEDIVRQKFLAKCRFRALVRNVIANLYWLTENEEEYTGDDVKRRVEQAMRSKSKKQNALLTLKDKALLNKPAADRTDAEKKYIYRKIGGLKCFKRYPNYVKKKLAAATYFKYYGPNRIIVKQNQHAHALYFVVTGEVVVSVLVYDDLLNKYDSVNVIVMHPGDMFGEVSLLHNIKRTATCTTTGHCEFLALMKEDFKNVLQASLQKQWDLVRKAMCSFTYFDTLGEVALREGCIVAKMKSYEPNDTILGDGVGWTNFVYFVLSGRCQMIETLKIGTVQIRNKKFYSLFDPFVPSEPSDLDLDLDSKYFKGLQKTPDLSHESKKTNLSENSKSEAGGSACTKLRNFGTETMDLSGKFKSERNSIGESLKSAKINQDTKHSRHATDKKSSILSKSTHSNMANTSDIKVIKPHCEQDIKSSIRLSTEVGLIDENTSNYKIYFMQVCIFKPGSTFGFGENMRDRRIVALDHVDCMLLPKMWLLQRNTANIWSRIQHYLEKKIPTKKQLFKEFVTQRQWNEARSQLVEEIVSRNKTINHTTVHDVPYSIRMEELYDI